ncbi:RHS repeat-associated core domain-containing protein [Paenibacillus periandrae]|uniref:RHS repeat-associated core domain-containing protein n=1 Tax=Paenibacillus periandrae TaxID=1761741 RepID=UPI001F096A1B|nr:RHS repeat-associated core domain-containing protein [Paenibacillus periandrae]
MYKRIFLRSFSLVLSLILIITSLVSPAAAADNPWIGTTGSVSSSVYTNPTVFQATYQNPNASATTAADWGLFTQEEIAHIQQSYSQPMIQVAAYYYPILTKLLTKEQINEVLSWTDEGVKSKSRQFTETEKGLLQTWTPIVINKITPPQPTVADSTYGAVTESVYKSKTQQARALFIPPGDDYSFKQPKDTIPYKVQIDGDVDVIHRSSVQRDVDLYLPGKNGLDLQITRSYNSMQANAEDYWTSTYSCTYQNEYAPNGNNYPECGKTLVDAPLNHHNQVATGWTLNIPSYSIGSQVGIQQYKASNYMYYSENYGGITYTNSGEQEGDYIRELTATLEDGTTYKCKNGESKPYNYPYDNVQCNYLPQDNYEIVVDGQISYVFSPNMIIKSNQYGDKITYTMTRGSGVYSVTIQDSLNRTVEMTVINSQGVLGIKATDANRQVIKNLIYTKSPHLIWVSDSDSDGNPIWRQERRGYKLDNVKDELAQKVIKTYTYYNPDERLADINMEDDYQVYLDGNGNPILDVTANGQAVESSQVDARMMGYQNVRTMLLKEVVDDIGYTTQFTYQAYDSNWRNYATYEERNRKRGTIHNYLDPYVITYKGYQPVVNVYHSYTNSDGVVKKLTQTVTGGSPASAPEVWTAAKTNGPQGNFRLSASGSYRSGDQMTTTITTDYGSYTDATTHQYVINREHVVPKLISRKVENTTALNVTSEDVHYTLGTMVTSYQYEEGKTKPYLVKNWSDMGASDVKPANIKSFLLNGNSPDLPSGLSQYATYTQYNYDSWGYVTKQQDSLNNRTEMAYNGVDHRISQQKVTSGDGLTINQEDYTYVNTRKTCNETNEDGNVIRTYVCYDPGHGRIQKSIQQQTYRNPAAPTESMTDTITTDYIIDVVTGVVTKMTETVGGTQYGQQPITTVRDFQYDAQKNHVTQSTTQVRLATDSLPTALTSGYLYDSRDRLTKQTYPDGSTANYEYDDKNRIQKLTFIPASLNLSEARTTTYTYEDAIRRVTKSMPDGFSTTITYTPYGEVEQQKQKSGAQERTVLVNQTDATGMFVVKSLPFNQEQLRTTRSYGPFGVTSVTNAMNETMTTSYANAAYAPNGSMSQLQQTSQTVEADGRQLWTFTDPYGRVTKQVEKSATKERVTAFSYNPSGKLVQKSVTGEGKTQTTKYGYDGAGHLTYVQDDKGQKHTYVYDAHGGVIAWSINGVKQKGTTYNEVGWPLVKTNAAGGVESIAYTTNGLVNTYKDKAGQTSTYTYTPYHEESRVSVANASGTEIYWKQNTYDAATRLLTALTSSEGEALSYHYDNWKRMDQETAAGRSYRLGYDAYDRLSTLKYPDEQVVSYGYDALSRITSVAYPGMGTVVPAYTVSSNEHTYSVTSGGLKQEKKTDGFKELISQKQFMNTTPTWTETFGYDGLGNISSLTRNGNLSTFTYDGLNRIAEEDGAGGTHAYTYDEKGNRLTMQSTGVQSVPEETQDFTYNAVNELKSFTNHAGTTASYSYYGDGLRATKNVNGNLTRYVYLNGKVIEELDANGNVKARNIWGNELLWRADNTTNKSGYYFYNGHGDVVAIKDAAGNNINTYDYDIWGNVLSKTEGMNNPYRYTGEPQDDESGLIYLRARYYDPTIGRFISQDTVEGDLNNPLSLNLYTYVQNNPLRYTDPSGHSVCGFSGYVREWCDAVQSMFVSKAQAGMDASANTANAILDFAIMDDVNTLLDPNSAKFDKTLAAAGFLPIGKVYKGGSLIFKLASREGRQIERVVEFAGEGVEKTLKTSVSSYEQARNLTLDILGDMGETQAYIGRLESSAGFGKVIGRESTDGKVRWRIDYDPEKGAHINIEDFRNGKGDKATKLVIPFDGNESNVKKIIDNLNK